MQHPRARYLLAASLAALSFAAPAWAQPESGAAVSEIVVTGTREEGRKARDSATPIDVVGSGVLAATGQTNVLDALKTVLPSLNAPAVGYDVGALARTFQLRGLSPSHTLVLVNGKRRHLSASIYADSDPAQGSNAVDLDMIPLSAVERIEVLRDGAAAQYGSDAIAGVVNVILKDRGDGGALSLLGGGYYAGDGQTYQADFDKGFSVGPEGRLHVGAGYRFHDFSNRSGVSTGPEAAKVQGDPRSRLFSASYDYAQPLGEAVTAYSFGSFADRRARAYENPRQPGWISDAVDGLYPTGFSPLETVSEHDFSLTAGVRGKGAWAWDLSTTYGRDNVRLRNIRSVNPDLLADTGNSQRDFYVGSFVSSEWTTNLDLRRAVDVGLSTPLNVAVGLEDRYQTFEIKAGEPNSYYGGGPSAFPGFRPSDEADAHRNSVAAYVDLTLHPTTQWELSLAGRGEHYDQVGDTGTGKVAIRYDATDRLAFRATAGTGFHAPTLAQQYYSATTVTTGFAAIQLPLGSAGARLLGAPDLKPETSRNLSFGLVAEPFSGVHVTLDAYRIDVDDRIIESAYLYGALAQSAIAANGSVVPAELSADNVSAVFFTNGVDTRTQGVDLTADWRQSLGDFGAIRWNLSLGYVETQIRRIHAAPKVLSDAGLSLVDAVQLTNLTSATPKYKASLAANWSQGPWSVVLRNTVYGNSVQAQGYGAPYYLIETGRRVVTDLDIGYQVSLRFKVQVGANNLFDVYPRAISPEVYQNLNYDRYSHVSPFGIGGGYYYLRLTASL